MKIYNRTIDDKGNDSLSKIIQQTPKSSRVLDIGCGAGIVGAALRANKDCYVAGIEYDLASAKLAEGVLNQVFQIDLNEQLIDEIITDTFDVIIMADILEHLYDPYLVLESAIKLLTPKGKVLISIPNAGYTGALLSLYDDEWRYQEEGILDRTHVRFYTKKSILSLLDKTGYTSTICDRVCKDLTESEFTQRIDPLNKNVRDWLLAKPEGATYQFILEARPKTQAHSFPAQDHAPAMSFLHITKLYWQNKKKLDFSEEKVVFQRGIMGQVNTLYYLIADDKLTKFRLDFADRRNIYHLDEITIFDGTTQIWQASQNAAEFLLHDCTTNKNSLPCQLNANSSDSFFSIAFKQPIRGKNLQIEVKLSAPISEQNLSFINCVEQDLYRKVVSQLQSANEQIQQLTEILASNQAEIANSNHKMSQQQIEIAQQKNNIISLNAQIEEIKNSTSWKITAPLRQLKNR